MDLPVIILDSTQLDLMNRPMDYIHSIEEIISKKKIKKLFLSYNLLVKVPLVIFEFTNLIKLNLSDNDLKSIPNDIQALNKLEYLYLNKNNFSIFPSSIFHCPRLKFVSLSDNYIKTLPKTWVQLSAEELVMNNNELTRLPFTIPENLQKLSICFNYIKKIPKLYKDVHVII